MTANPRVFLGINTLVSGIVFSGNEAKLLDAIIDRKLEWVVSTDVIDETSAVLERKFPKRAVLFQLFLRLVKHEKILRDEYESSMKEYSKLTNGKDASITSAAITGQADYLVTSDKRLCNLEQIKKTGITQTKRLLENWKSKQFSSSDALRQ